MKKSNLELQQERNRRARAALEAEGIDLSKTHFREPSIPQPNPPTLGHTRGGPKPKPKPPPAPDIEHGTHRGYQMELRRGIPTCDECRAFEAADSRKRYHNRRKEGRKVQLRDPIDHGTAAGYQAHMRSGILPCDPCKQAEAERKADYRAERKDTG